MCTYIKNKKVMFLATVLLTLIDGVCSFSFLKQPCSPGSDCERMVVRKHEESFAHMNWHL